MPVVLIFWLIILCMAWWQIHRVTQLKKDIIYEQLNLIADRLVAIYDNDEDGDASSFMTFVNQYYLDNLDYDAMSVLVFDSHGAVETSIGNITQIDYSKPVSYTHLTLPTT